MTSVVPDPAALPPQTARVLNAANALTVLRLLLVPVVALTLLHDNGRATAWRVAACVVFGVASITDRIDGDLARRRGLITEFGKLADPLADKALTGTALVGLSTLGLLPWWVTLVILVREVGVTLLRFWVIRHGVIPASRGGKAKTLTQSVAIGLYLLPLSGPLASAAAWIMGVAVILTVATGADYVTRALTLRRTSARAQRKHASPATETTGEAAIPQPGVAVEDAPMTGTAPTGAAGTLPTAQARPDAGFGAAAGTTPAAGAAQGERAEDSVERGESSGGRPVVRP